MARDINWCIQHAHVEVVLANKQTLCPAFHTCFNSAKVRELVILPLVESVGSVLRNAYLGGEHGYSQQPLNTWCLLMLLFPPSHNPYCKVHDEMNYKSSLNFELDP